MILPEHPALDKARTTHLGHLVREAHAAIYVCSNGVLVPSKRSPLFSSPPDWRRNGSCAITRDDGLLLPTCRDSDTLLAQPPLAVALTDDQLIAIARAEGQGIVAATTLGPPQEKTRNEDFALAAVFVDRHGTNHAFVAVADGVTSKTFWAERASRLACFVALQVAMDYVDGPTEYSVGDIEIVRQALATQLRRTLQFDRRWIISEGAHPPDWDPSSFKKFSENDAFWYNSTLLMSLVSPKGGMLLWAGDGAIHIKKDFGHGKSEVTSPLRSKDDVTVANVVSLGGPILFAGGRLDTFGSLNSLTVTLCTDGPDRTLQRNGDPDVFNVSDSREIEAALDKLGRLPNHEIDNYSAAVARWPAAATKMISRDRIEHLLWPPVAKSSKAERSFRSDQYVVSQAHQMDTMRASSTAPRKFSRLF